MARSQGSPYGRGENRGSSCGFVLIGAWPNTNWLAGVIARDSWGYVLTGDDFTRDGTAWPDERAPLPFETSLPGVFAVGDVRHGSVKRPPQRSARAPSPFAPSTTTFALSTTRSQ